MAQMIRFSGLMFLFVIMSNSQGFAIQDDPQIPRPKPNPGPPPLTLELSASPDTVVVGHSVTLHAAESGGTPGYTFSFSFDCAPNHNELIVNETDPVRFKTFCVPKVGAFLARAEVVDSIRNRAEDSTEVTSQAPDNLSPTPSIDDVSDEGEIGDVVSVLHKYLLQRGKTHVGPCLHACASEKAWDVDPNVSEPDEWQLTGCECEEVPAFCFHAPYVYDRKQYVIPATWQGTPWNDVPDGTIVHEFMHRIKVDVPKCGGEFLEVKTGPMIMQVIKVSDKQIQFKLANQ